MAASAYGGQGPLVLGITWTEAGLALILIGLRAKTACFCRPGQLSSGIFGIRWDFFWVILGVIVALAAQSTMTMSVRYGLGQHESELADENIVETNLWSWIAQILAILCLPLARIAVIAFLLSLEAGTTRRGRWILYVVGALQGVINVIEVGFILRQCDPVQRLWDPSIPGTCDMVLVCSQVGYLQGSIGAAADIFLAFYPIRIVGRLQKMKLSLKISLCLIMGGGLIAGIAGINKTVAISLITQTQDITYFIWELNTWVLTEMWFVIIFGSIPVLRPFFIRFSQNIKSTTAYSRERSNFAANLSASVHNQNDPWIQLHDGNQAWITSANQGQATPKSRSEDEATALPDPSNGRILVTKDTLVTSTYSQ